MISNSIESFGDYQYHRSLVTNRWTIALSLMIVLFYIPIDPKTLSGAQAEILGFLRIFLYLPLSLLLFSLTFLNVPRRVFFFACTFCYTSGGVIFILIDNFWANNYALHSLISAVHAQAFLLVGVIIPLRFCMTAGVFLYALAALDISLAQSIAFEVKVSAVSGLTGMTVIMLSWAYIREREARALYRNEMNRQRANQLQYRWSEYFLTVLRQEIAYKLDKVGQNLKGLEGSNVRPQYLERSQQAWRKSHSLIEKLLSSVSWRDALSLTTNNRLVSSDLLADFFQECQIQYPEVDFRLTLESNFDFRGDPIMITRALDNLVDNAVRLHDQGTAIVIGSREGNEIFVANTGPDLPENIADMFRYGASGSQSERGLFGLGLFLVHQICEHHLATICARQDGRRVEFALRFSP